jgi:hypothetical protein
MIQVRKIGPELHLPLIGNKNIDFLSMSGRIEKKSRTFQEFVIADLIRNDKLLKCPAFPVDKKLSLTFSVLRSLRQKGKEDNHLQHLH